ncbi:MAG: flagellar motor switch protein FliN [Gammaproteobacteria bacterium]|nr:flagellar motor switch protein FliN [Gammaproteobacteria bacterium]
MTETTDQTTDDKTTTPGGKNPSDGSAVATPDTTRESKPDSVQGQTQSAAAQLGDLGANRPESGAVEWDLEMVADIPVTLSVEVGRSAISIHNLLQLSQGSIVELDRNSGEPLDVLVNGCLVAHGEVVVVNEKFGIRLTDVVSPGERFKKLN